MSALVAAKPANRLLNKSMLERINPITPAVMPGMLFWFEPGTMADRTLVPKNGDLIENQSGWARDLLGEGARYLAVTSSITTGTVSRQEGTGALDVLHKRGVATQGEILSFANQTIRDHVDATVNRTSHLYANVFACQVLEKAADTYVPKISERIMGLVDSTNYKTAIAVSSDRTQLTGYPTGATRVFNQPGSATAGRSLVVTVHNGYAGAASASATLMSLHNGGAGSPAPSFRVFQAGLADLTVAKLTPAEFFARMLARYNQCQAPGSIYAA